MDNLDNVQLSSGDAMEIELKDDTVVPEVSSNVPVLDVNSFSRQDIFHEVDPLKYADQYTMPPCYLDLNDSHFVKPHAVEGYTRADGTHVDGYFRDGDGDTDVNRTIEQGGGYFRSDG